MSTPNNGPLARVKQEFGGKDKLVDKIVSLIDAGDESKDDLRKRLLGAANGKLIKLHTVASEVKKEGGHDKLVAATAASLNRSKDKDYVEKLSTFSDARLLDIKKAADVRAKRVAAKAKDGAAKAPAAKKAAPAKGSKKSAAGKAAAQKSA